MKKIITILALILVLIFALTACGKDGLTPTIEISDDGYWVINGEKTDVKAEADSNGGSGSANENPQGLDFYLKDDGTYAVAIGNAKYLSEIVIPETYLGKAVTEIAYLGFDQGRNLKSVTIPDSVTYIGDSAFNGCSSLTDVVIGNSVTYIDEYAFNGCSDLTDVVIGDSVTYICDFAFTNCSSLTDVVIGDSVTYIGEYAFNCCELKNVYYTGSEEEWKAIAIVSEGNYYLTYATIHYNYVPEE